MTEIPPQLIASLRELGLLESEAKIYTALVLLHDAEVRELQDFLGLSKPNVYAGLRALEEKGFIILINPRPTTYQSIPPEIALGAWTEKWMKAKDDAIASIHAMEKRKNVEKAHPIPWFLFGTKHFRSKIRDMVDNSEKSLYCITSAKYLEDIRPMSKRDIDIDLTIISDDTDIQRKVERTFDSKRTRVRTLSKDQIARLSGPEGKATDNGRTRTDLRAEMHNYDNMFMLLADNIELFYIPPLNEEEEDLIAIATKNRTFVQGVKAMNEKLIEAAKTTERNK